MTDRAEIERLLNATGRTLEGVTKVEIGYGSRRNGKTMSIIMHQSDVIELLVGALKDALDKQPKWISVKDRLPEAYEDGSVDAVLVTNGFLIHMAYYVEGTWVFCESGEMKEPMFYDVTHWMPLPKAPEEE